MLRWVCALALVTCLDQHVSQGLSIFKKDDLGDNALVWIQQKEEKANVELSSAQKNLVEMVNKLIDEGVIEIDSSVDKALQDLRAFEQDVPKNCHATTKDSLADLERTKKDYFLSCVKSSKFVQEILQMSEKSEELGAEFFSMTRDGTNAIADCSRQGIMRAYQCGASAIWEIIKNVMSGYSEMKHFIVSFTVRGTHARKDIHNCLHPEGIDIQDHVDKVMEVYHTCVGSKQPN